MKYNAVIFDLFGTLVNSYSLPTFNTMLEKMASILGIPHMEFIRSWVQEAKASMSGLAANPAQSVKKICLQAGVNPTPAKIKKVVNLRLNFERQIMFNPRPDAMDILRILKIHGYKLGLISDCTSEAPEIWDETPMAPFIDVPLFSSLTKIKKPDPRIYYMMTDALKVNPSDCLYIGDGSSRELSGAKRVEMYPIQVRIPSADESANFTIIQENWEGHTITSFHELLHVLDLPNLQPMLSVLYNT